MQLPNLNHNLKSWFSGAISLRIVLVIFAVVFLSVTSLGSAADNGRSEFNESRLWVTDCEISSPIIEICKSGLSSQKSAEQNLLTRLKLVDAIRARNFLAALDECDELVMLAEEFGDENFVAASKLQRIVVRCGISGRAQVQKELDLTEYVLNPKASSDLRLFHGLSLLALEIQTLNMQARFPPLFDLLDEAAKQCDDENLLARRCALEIYARMALLGQRHDNEEVVRLRDKLNALDFQKSFPDSEIFLKYHASLTANAVKSENAEKYLDEAIQLAELMGNRQTQTQLIYFKSYLLLRKKNPESALVSLSGALKIARKTDSEPLTRLILEGMAAAHGKLGQTKQRLKCLKQVEKSDSFKDKSAFSRNQQYMSMASAHSVLGESRLAAFYKKKQIPVEFASLAEPGQLSTLADMLYTSNKNVDRSLKSVSFFKRYSIVSTLLISIMVPIGLFLVFRNRLSLANLRLRSERRNLENQKKNYDELASRHHRLQRMESLGLMAGNFAHDFNNILVGVLGNAEIIQLTNDAEEFPQVHERVDSIIKSAERAATLSHQMLAYSGNQFTCKEICDLNEIIAQSELALNSQLKSDQAIVLELSSEAVTVAVDLVQVKQALLNLVSNAVSASPEGKEICIRTGRHFVEDVSSDSTYFGPRETGGEFGFFEVSDEGGGISGFDLERIFEPFYSNRKSDGRGLGLAVVYGIVKGHDGLIQCVSAVDHSTRFRILFPIESDVPTDKDSFPTTQADVEVGSEPNLSEQSDKTIVVIDDERAVLDACENLLRLQGFDSMVALGGKQGLETLIDYQNEVSCVLLDVMMPELDGETVLSELQTRGIEMPVVLMCGYSETKVDDLLEHPMIVASIQKPFSADTLQAGIRKGLQAAGRKRPAS